MLKLKKLRLKNFISHENTEVDFTDPQRLLIDGKSGSGKSAVVEAVIWVLYGKGRSDNRSLVKRGKVTALVELWLEDEKHTYRVARSINKTGKHELIVEQDNLIVPVAGIKAVQEYLEKDILHSSYLLFINSVVYPQDNTENFVRQTAGKRKDLLLEIANASRFDEYLEMAKARITDNMARVNELGGALPVLRDSLLRNEQILIQEPILQEEYNSLEKDLKSLDEQLRTIDGELFTIDQIEELLKDCETKITELNNDKISLTRQVSETEELLKRADGQLVEELKKESFGMEEAEKQLTLMLSKLDAVLEYNKQYAVLINQRPVTRDYDRELSLLNTQLISLIKNDQKGNWICPKCGLETSKTEICIDSQTEAIDRQNRIDYLEKEIKQRTAERVEYLRLLEECNQNEVKLIKPEEVKMADIDFLRHEISLKKTAKNRLDEILLRESTINSGLEAKKEALLASLVEIDRQIPLLIQKKEDYGFKILTKPVLLDRNRALSLDKNDKNARFWDVKTQLGNISRIKEEVALNRQKEAELSQELEGLKSENDDLILLKEALGNNGIKSIVVDYITPRLEDKINNILSQLSDFRIKLETSRPGITNGALLEGLFITIINDQGEELDFENYSGGERLKIVVAISEALAEIQKIGFRIMDEVFLGLDDESIDKFAEVMEILQTRFNQLICVSHLRNIKDLFNDKLLVTKTNGTSTVV